MAVLARRHEAHGQHLGVRALVAVLVFVARAVGPVLVGLEAEQTRADGRQLSASRAAQPARKRRHGYADARLGLPARGRDMATSGVGGKRRSRTCAPSCSRTAASNRGSGSDRVRDSSQSSSPHDHHREPRQIDDCTDARRIEQLARTNLAESRVLSAHRGRVASRHAFSCLGHGVHAVVVQHQIDARLHVAQRPQTGEQVALTQLRRTKQPRGRTIRARLVAKLTAQRQAPHAMAPLVAAGVEHATYVLDGARAGRSPPRHASGSRRAPAAPSGCSRVNCCAFSLPFSCDSRSRTSATSTPDNPRSSARAARTA